MTRAVQLLREGLRFGTIPYSQLDVALEVRRRVYVNDAGYAARSVLNDEFDARSQHFVALTAAGVPIASMRILPGFARPFEFEKLADVQVSIENDSAEISRLCILPEYRAIKRNQFVHAGMWEAALQFAHLSNINTFWIWTEPVLARIYSFLGFSPIENLTFHHPVLNKQYQVMRLVIENLPHAERIATGRRVSGSQIKT